LTVRTGWNITLFDVCLHARPIVRVSQSEIGFVNTKVTKGIMCKAEEEFTDTRDAQNHESIADIEKAIGARCTRDAANVREETTAEGVIIVAHLDLGEC